jgi:hypothetical protein
MSDFCKIKLSVSRGDQRRVRVGLGDFSEQIDRRIYSRTEVIYTDGGFAISSLSSVKSGDNIRLFFLTSSRPVPEEKSLFLTTGVCDAELEAMDRAQFFIIFVSQCRSI